MQGLGQQALQQLHRLNTRAGQAIFATVAFLVVTWALVRQPNEVGEVVCGQVPKDVADLIEGRGNVSVVLRDLEGSYLQEPSPLSCGYKKTRKQQGTGGQEALLQTVVELKVLLDTLNVSYWVDRDNLASVIQTDESGHPVGHFHPLDTMFELGMFTPDVSKIHEAFETQNLTIDIGEQPTSRDLSGLPRLVHQWKAAGSLVVLSNPVLGASGTALKVYSKKTGHAVLVTAYHPTQDAQAILPPSRLGTHTIPLSTLLPLRKCLVYEVNYPCPNAPADYLNELAGGSWLSRTKGSRLKWAFVAVVFLSLVYWVFKRS